MKIKRQINYALGLLLGASSLGLISCSSDETPSTSGGYDEAAVAEALYTVLIADRKI